MKGIIKLNFNHLFLVSCILSVIIVNVLTLELHNNEKFSILYNETYFGNENQPEDLFNWKSWLQEVPEESKIAKSRQKRRFMNFPVGSYMYVSLFS